MKGSPENLSRREFLKATVAGGIFLAEFLISGPARAALEKLFGSQEYRNEDLESLLRRMERMVYDDVNEVMWVYVERGNKQYAINVLKEATDRSAQGIDLTPLYEDQAVSKAYLLHTHPAALFLADPSFPREKAEKILREKRSDYSRILSPGDILECVADKMRLLDLDIRRESKHFLVEPSGIWSYDVDLSHPSTQEMLSGGDGDSRAEMVRSNGLLAMVLQVELEEWQKKLSEGEGMTTATLEEFITWAKETYGIILEYRRTVSSL